MQLPPHFTSAICNFRADQISMNTSKQALALLCAVCALSTHAHASVLLLDSRHNTYLDSSVLDRQHVMSIAQIHGVVSALTGLQPAMPIDASTSNHCATFVKPSLLRKPEAHLNINVAGLTADDLKNAFGSRGHVIVTLPKGEAGAELEMLPALQLANPGIRVSVAGTAQECEGDAGCVERLLQKLASIVKGRFDADNQRLILADGTALGLDNEAERRFVTELAAVVTDVAQVVEQHKEGVHDLHAVDITLLSLDDIMQNDAGKYTSCTHAVVSTLSWAVDQLDASYDGDMTIQVVLMESENPGQGWKTERHSRLLQEANNGTGSQTSDWPPADETAAAKMFSTKAAGYGAFILLLYFMLAGTYCLCFMPFKQDTLLFGSKKMD